MFDTGRLAGACAVVRGAALQGISRDAELWDILSFGLI
jgi:hypothetical protein